MAIITRAQAKKKLEKLSPDSPRRDCPVCGDHIYDSDDGWEYVKTKGGSEVFIHTFCAKMWGSNLSPKEISKLRKEHELNDF